VAVAPVRSRLDRAWRVVGTGLSFALFGLANLAFGLVAAPALTVLVRSPERRTRLAQRIVRGGLGAFVRWMQLVGVLTWEVRGADRLEREGLLVVANHPTLIDVIFLLALVPRGDCVVKASLARNPFTRGPVRVAGFVCNDAGPDVIDGCVASLARGHDLVVFPEGTRTEDGPPRLHRGAAHVALRAGRDLTPVTVRCEPPTLRKGEPWYRVPARRPHFTIEVGDDIPIAPFIASEPSFALAARRLTDYLGEHWWGHVDRG
jgi:1-acyl-sn-glycerol-3-phosphate acyltransferase